MGSLDDKLLGEKIHNYCSSSEDEADDNNLSSEPPQPNSMHWSGQATNTGPKGVIKDWQRFKQLETEKREEAERERLELIKKLSITSKTNEEDKEAEKQELFDAELEELMNDEFLLEYQRQRMKEMLEQCGKLPKFGMLQHLEKGEQLLDSIDNEIKSVTIILHIYDERLSSCKILNKCLQALAKEYDHIKFCKIQSNSAGMSLKFKQHGLPALLVYKNGQIIGNFIRISDELGEDFCSSDVESFLAEHSLLPDKSCIPVLSQNLNNIEDD
ncbi:phosducin-like protein [Culicoides brevitarsis]|uniref:phosducin-like protein n=1 Tax=Culicoides brevitarsis TaxID=469753 RepID=UPI00307C1942